MSELLVTLVKNPDRVGEVPPESIPALMTELAAVQARLVAQLLNAEDVGRRNGDENDAERLFAIADVADRLRLTKAYVYELIRQGRLPAVRIGKYLRVRAADLSRWIEEQLGQVDKHLYDTYNFKHDRPRAAAHPQGNGAYPSRIRGPRRRRSELDRPPGAGRNRDSRASGETDPNTGSTGSWQPQAGEAQEITDGIGQDGERSGKAGSAGNLGSKLLGQRSTKASLRALA